MPEYSLFTVETDGLLQEIEERLGDLRDRVPRVLKKALNATAKKTGKELAKLAQERYRVKNVAFAREIKITSATEGNLTAVLEANGKTLPTKQFKVSPSKPEPTTAGSPPAKVAILKAKSPRTVVSQKSGLLAFIAQFSSGHIAVVQREPPRKYTSKGWKQRTSKWAEFERITGKLDNTRVQELYGPSVPMMLFKTGIEQEFIETLNPKIVQYLRDAITTQINTEIFFASKG